MRLMHWLAVLAIPLVWPTVPAPAGAPLARLDEAVCTAVDDVDSCWTAGVLAERRGDAAAAFAAYDRSCSAGLTGPSSCSMQAVTLASK